MSFLLKVYGHSLQLIIINSNNNAFSLNLFIGVKCMTKILGPTSCKTLHDVTKGSVR